jgi:predicted PurR-regulated permease PerM
MWIVGLSAPVFWGAIIAILAFLPLVGTNVVVIPATLFLVLDGRWLAGIAFFVLTNLQGLLIDNVVKTKLIGNRMQMHTLLMFLALLGGISSFGFAGLLYGPLIVALFVTIVELYERVYRARLLPRCTERSVRP